MPFALTTDLTWPTLGAVLGLVAIISAFMRWYFQTHPPELPGDDIPPDYRDLHARRAAD